MLGKCNKHSFDVNMIWQYGKFTIIVGAHSDDNQKQQLYLPMGIHCEYVYMRRTNSKPLKYQKWKLLLFLPFLCIKNYLVLRPISRWKYSLNGRFHHYFFCSLDLTAMLPHTMSSHTPCLYVNICKTIDRPSKRDISE